MAALALAASTGLAACGSGQVASQPSQQEVQAHLQPALNALTAWRDSAFPADLAPEDAPAALQRRVVALDDLQRTSRQWSDYLATRSDLTSNPQVGPALSDFAAALVGYVQAIEPAMDFFEECLPAQPRMRQLETCTTELNQKFGDSVTGAEANLSAALTQLTASSNATP